MLGGNEHPITALQMFKFKDGPTRLFAGTYRQIRTWDIMLGSAGDQAHFKAPPMPRFGLKVTKVGLWNWCECVHVHVFVYVYVHVCMCGCVVVFVCVCVGGGGPCIPPSASHETQERDTSVVVPRAMYVNKNASFIVGISVVDTSNSDPDVETGRAVVVDYLEKRCCPNRAKLAKVQADAGAGGWCLRRCRRASAKEKPRDMDTHVSETYRVLGSSFGGEVFSWNIEVRTVARHARATSGHAMHAAQRYGCGVQVGGHSRFYHAVRSVCDHDSA